MRCMMRTGYAVWEAFLPVEEGWLVAGWLVADWLAAGWWLAGWQAGGRGGRVCNRPSPRSRIHLQ